MSRAPGAYLQSLVTIRNMSLILPDLPDLHRNLNVYLKFSILLWQLIQVKKNIVPAHRPNLWAQSPPWPALHPCFLPEKPVEVCMYLGMQIYSVWPESQ